MAIFLSGMSVPRYYLNMTIPLHNHSEYSIINGTLTIDDLVTFAADNALPAIALTDHNNIFGAVKFYKKCLANNVKPIIGCDLSVRIGIDVAQIVLLCKNETGFVKLNEYLTRAYYLDPSSPHIYIEDIQADDAENFIAICGPDSHIGRQLTQRNTKKAEQTASLFKATFTENLFIEITDNHREDEESYNAGALHLCRGFEIPPVAGSLALFKQKSDYQSHEAKYCIQNSYLLNDSRRPRPYTEYEHLKTPQEILDSYSELQPAIDNARAIAIKCTMTMDLGNNYLPAFPGNTDLPEYEALKQTAHENLTAFLDKNDFSLKKKELYQSRLEFELNVINNMGFPGYFLIVADFVNWAKNNNIPVGPGRGSGAGSLVAFVLGITEIEPIKYDLLFERFLNPERVSMPDFDVDFCMRGRDRVIDYIRQRYGKDKVSQIITFGTMAAKAVVRDIGRILQIPYPFVDRIAKLIPNEVGIKIQAALEYSDELMNLYQSDPEAKELIDLAMKLEGQIRHAGKHAGGVVISRDAITRYTPLYVDENGFSLTQFDKNDVEDAGLVKFDLLGLKTLTVIKDTIDIVNESYREEGDLLSINDINFDDAPTIELLKSGNTIGVFQLESKGMRELIKKMEPASFEEIIALVALYRPGPLQSGMVDDYIARKHGRAEIEYPHLVLGKILEPTYGVILYQEQVMQVAQELSGYTLGQADLLRRAMGKKKPEEMAKQREIFVNGAKEKHGIDDSLATHIFDLIEKFAGYGFNKSHSAAYAYIAFQTAWLKAHYPAAFLSALMSNDMENTDKLADLVRHARNTGFSVYRPDINKSTYTFRAKENNILFGLGAIKGLGKNAVETIIEERTRSGQFQSLFDFCARVDMSKISRKAIEALVMCGAFDSIGPNRGRIFAAVSQAAAIASQAQQVAKLGQTDMFGTGSAVDSSFEEHYPVGMDWDFTMRLEKEMDTCGVYLSGHPLMPYREALANMQRATANQVETLPDGKMRLVGYVMNATTRLTRARREKMAILTLDDGFGNLEVAVFPDQYQQFQAHCVKGAVVSARINKSHSDSGELRLSVDSLEPLPAP